MKKFQFTLQKLYEVKVSEEKAQRARLGQLEQNLRNYERQKAANQALYDREQAKYAEKRQHGMSALELQRFGDWFHYLEEEMRQQETVIQSARRSVEDCRNGIVKLINEQRVLDEMRDQQYEEYKKEVAKEEDKGIEDFLQARMKPAN